MKNIIVWSIKSCEGHVIGKKGSAELVGYDFMIDENLNPWLIEINMSPSMDYSTPVTKKLVKLVLQDTAKIISASKKPNNSGLFSCIYEGNKDLEKFNIYKI
jgi:tubulin monoglycylase TTLL3/8